MMHSAQNLWRHSLVVIVEVSMSRQMGQVSSDCRDYNKKIINLFNYSAFDLMSTFGDTAISVLSVIAS